MPLCGIQNTCCALLDCLFPSLHPVRICDKLLFIQGVKVSENRHEPKTVYPESWDNLPELDVELVIHQS